MLVDLQKKTIKCFMCNEWYSAHTHIFLHVKYEGSLTCPKNHVVGHESDKEWEELFQ